MHDRYTLGFEIGKTLNNSKNPAGDIRYLILLLLQHWKTHVKEQTNIHKKIQEIIEICYL